MLMLLEALGAMTGLIGAVCVTSRKRTVRATGFATWIASNGFFIAFTIATGAWWMFGMFLAYLGTSLFGLWNNVRPHKDG